MRAGRGAPRGTLPAAPVRLVPRDHEQREILRLLLDDGVRLLTLVGPPGAGKTRLAVMAAGEVATAFGDGVVFVDLSVLHDAALVPAAIGAALGMREATNRMTERLKVVLSRRHLLLLLDNLEHLLLAAPLRSRPRHDGKVGGVASRGRSANHREENYAGWKE